MKLRRSSLLFFVIVMLSSCADADDSADLSVFTLTSDFNQSQNGWTGDFADYKVDDDDTVAFNLNYDSLPSYLPGKPLRMSGTNIGDNLFMFIKKKINGLSPNTDYTLVYDITFASNAQVGTDANRVMLKVGATSFEPLKSDKNGYYRMNIDKGSAIEEGSDMVNIGTIGIENSTEEFEFISRSNSTSANPFFKGTTNKNGEIWLIIGTDSYVKGRTTIFYSEVKVIVSASH